VKPGRPRPEQRIGARLVTVNVASYDRRSMRRRSTLSRSCMISGWTPCGARPQLHQLHDHTGSQRHCPSRDDLFRDPLELEHGLIYRLVGPAFELLCATAASNAAPRRRRSASASAARLGRQARDARARLAQGAERRDLRQRLRSRSTRSHGRYGVKNTLVTSAAAARSTRWNAAPATDDGQRSTKEGNHDRPKTGSSTRRSTRDENHHAR
jgi:hypothetical protein